MWRGLIMSLQAMPGLENNFRSHPIWSTLHGLGTRNGSLEWNNVPLKQRCKYNILHKGIAVYTIYNVITVEWHIRVTLPAQRPVWMLQNLLLLCILYYLQEYWPPEINIYTLTSVAEKNQAYMHINEIIRKATLMSLCMIPFLCKYSSPSNICFV
jgi:hypothetical protein